MAAKTVVLLFNLVGTAPAPSKPAHALREPQSHQVVVQTRVGTFLCNERMRAELEKVISGEPTPAYFYAWAGD